jgi:hypothetical protein
MNGLRYLRKFVNRKKNTNFILIIITVPHRYDLMYLSCVNEEVKAYNRKMYKIMKLEGHVKLLDIRLDRSCYTRHGLHLNKIGKENVKEMVTNQIRTFTTEDRGSIIAQTWVGNLDELCQEKETDSIGTEADELQMKDGKERKEGEEDSDGESGNLNDCDQVVGMHKNSIGGKVARKQQKAIVRNVGVEEDNLESCMLG